MGALFPIAGLESYWAKGDSASALVLLHFSLIGINATLA